MPKPTLQEKITRRIDSNNRKHASIFENIVRGASSAAESRTPKPVFDDRREKKNLKLAIDER